jgi:uncharacterized protein YraI
MIVEACVKRLSTFIWAFVLMMVAPVLIDAQATDCPTTVKNALDATNNVCSTTGRNQACYGNINLAVESQADAPSFTFTKPGDLVSVDGIKTLTLSPLDANANTWGVALMKIQANLPDTLPGQNVVFVLFGDVQMDNAVEATLTLDVTAKQTANVRQAPSTTATVVTSLKGGTALVADGRSEDSSWLRVHSADLTVQGWISAPLVKTVGDLNTLSVVSADAAHVSPMQAFHFKTGLSDAPCSAAPDSGILIQTPKGAGKITLTANDVQITLGSTAYFQAQASGFMTISVVEGQGAVTAAGTTMNVPAGTRVRVPLDNTLSPSGTPIGPEPYEDAHLAVLPIGLLTETITTAPALSANAIATAAAEIQPLPGIWTSSADVVNASIECGIASGQNTLKTTFTGVESPYDLAQIISLSGQRVPLSDLNPTHQGNTYTVDYDDGTIQTHMEVKVLSTTLMQRDSVTTAKSPQGCVTTVSGTFEHVGG